MSSVAIPAQSSVLPAFADARRTRLALGTLLYLAQGFPQGVVFYAIPTWLAAKGQSAVVVGAAASAASLPWMLKFFMGAVMDRYTWLPMGRRRPWLIGAQSMIALAFLAYALISPLPTQTSLVIGFSLLISSLTAIQDVALDALVIDLTPDDEMGRMNSFMFAGKLLGIAGGMAVTGYFMQYHSIGAAMIAMLVLFAIPAAASIVVRERSGEKRLPWNEGCASSETAAVKPQAWLPILRVALRTMVRRDTLCVVAMLVLYGVYQALFEQGSSLFLVRRLGWGEGQIGGVNAIANLINAGISLTLGAILIDRVGPRRMALIVGTAAGIVLATLAATQDQWHAAPAILAILGLVQVFTTLFYLSFLVLAMRVSAAEIAATSFALIIATHSLGLTFGGWLLGRADSGGGFVAVYGLAAMLLIFSGLAAQGVARSTGGTQRAGKDRMILDTPATAH
jgi:MFS transporter, PAT family, beta-lactamase induction signal transducer AmpG